MSDRNRPIQDYRRKDTAKRYNKPSYDADRFERPPSHRPQNSEEHYSRRFEPHHYPDSRDYPPPSYPSRNDPRYEQPPDRLPSFVPPQRNRKPYPDEHYPPPPQAYSPQDPYYDDRRNYDDRDYRPRHAEPSYQPYPERPPNRPARRSPHKDRRPDVRVPNSVDIIEDSIFVSNLPMDASVEELADLFGSIGLIKMDKRTGLYRIKIYKHPNGKPKGEASVSFDDPQTARAAIEWFNHTALRGNTIKVQMAERTYSTNYINRNKNASHHGPPKHRDNRVDRDDDRDGRNPSKPSCIVNSNCVVIQPGDWACTSCKNSNFAWRTLCNRCQTPKPQTGEYKESFQRSYQNNPEFRDR